VPVPAPFGGLNTRDALSALQLPFAPLLVNFFPGTSDLRIRKGHEAHATSLPAQVETLASYAKLNGAGELYAVSNGEIYDVTASGAVGAAAVSGLTNSRFQWVNYTNSAGSSYLCMFNGADGPQYWDGSSWTTITGASSPAITGVTPTTLIGVAVHKRRMWLIEKDKLKAWYLPVDSVGGAAIAFDLAGVVTRGGYLMAIGTWTRDGGDGVDDLWIGITSEGEVVIYQGTDPSSSSSWSLVGRWLVGEPIGRRCMVEYKSDLLLLTVDGIVPVSRLARIEPNNLISALIGNSFVYSTENYKTNFGWEMTYFANGEHLIVNVPNREGSQQTQFVMNSTSGAWTTYEDWEFNTFVVHNGLLYAGGNLIVNKMWSSNADAGAQIVAEAQQAFSDLGGGNNVKQFVMGRLAILSNGTPTVSLAMNTDYDIVEPTDAVTLTAISGDVWDTGVWDTAIWGGSALEVRLPWSTLTGVGIHGGVAVKMNTAGAEVRWTATDVIYQRGKAMVAA
jgi:hypothetical protein